MTFNTTTTSGKRFTGTIGAHAMALALVTLSAPVHAQTAPAESSQNPSDEAQQSSAAAGGDIVVTALKGNVSVQRAPITVNVVSGEAIVNKGITSVEQLTVAVPGVRINQAPGGNINPVVRGLGSSPSNNSFEQTVGLFVDGIFAGHPRDYAAALFDLERVELLKGTQSAVVGKNTSVGAISLVTAKPSFEIAGNASYYHEFELNTDTVNAAVNLPLSESVAVRVAGLYSDEGGWVRKVLDSGDEPGINRKAIRGSIRFQPNDTLDWTVSAQYAEYKQTGQYFHTGIDLLGNAALGASRGGDTGFTIRRYETRSTPRAGFSYRGLTDTGSHNNGTRLNSTLTYQLGSTTLTSITGYSEYTDTYMIDGSALINSPVIRAGHEKDENFSQELRVVTDTQAPLSIIAGAYYYNDDWTYEDLFDFNAAQMIVPPYGGSFRSSYRQKIETVSLFGQALYKLTDKLQVSGGIRYEHFKKTGDYSDRVVLIPGLLTREVYGPYPAFSVGDSKDYVDYSLQAQYFFSPRINSYISFATGTKGFGYVSTPSSPVPVGGTVGVVTGPGYKTEQSETWEAGVKVGLGGGSNVNIALFNTRIKDYQIAVNTGALFITRNDQIRSRGVEGSVNLELLEGLRLSATATYADARKLGTLPANSIRGLPFAPKWSGLGTLSYVSPYSGGLRFKSDVSMEFRSSQHLNDVVTFPISSVPGRVRTDLRLAVEHEKTGVEVAFVGRNMFDVYAYSYGFSQFGAPGAAQLSEEMPRTLALQVSFKY